MVDGGVFGNFPASRYRSGWCFRFLNCLTQSRIEYGAGPPCGLADGVVIGLPNFLASSRAILLSGILIPIEPVPAERSLIAFVARRFIGNTKVSGPGQNFFINPAVRASTIAHFFAAEKL